MDKGSTAPWTTSTQEELDATGLLVVVANEAWRVPSGFLSRSLVVQKLARREDTAAGERFVVRPVSEEALHCLAATVSWPTSLKGFSEWIQACDFLLLGPWLHEVAFAAACALHPWLSEATHLLLDCSSLEALAHSRRCRSSNTLAPRGSFNGPWEGLEENEYPGRDQAEARMREASGGGDASPYRASFKLSAFAESGFAIVDVIHVLVWLCRVNEGGGAGGGAEIGEGSFLRGDVFARPPGPLKGVIETASQTIVALTNTVAGSLHVLRATPSLREAYGVLATRHFVHRCFCCLYLSESLEEGSCTVPLDLVHDLQRLYMEGDLSLNTFVPARDRRRYLLPGLLGAAEVSPVLGRPLEVLARACALVPWLSRVMATSSPTLHLTGSFLCWCRSEVPDIGRPPDDVDLFCEDPSRLEEAALRVGKAMFEYIKADWPSASLEETRPSPRRVRLRVVVSEVESLAAEGLIVPPFLCQCDVYVNSLARVSQYHLPQVRACLSLNASGPQLFLTPSAAIAWITMLNIDYNAFKGAKTPLEIVARRWTWGFNICLSSEEASVVNEHLRQFFPVEYNRAVFMERPLRLNAFEIG